MSDLIKDYYKIYLKEEPLTFNVNLFSSVLTNLYAQIDSTPIFYFDKPDEGLVNNYDGYIYDSVTFPLQVGDDVCGNVVNYYWPGTPYYGTSSFTYSLYDLSNNLISNNEILIELVYSLDNACDTGPGPNPTRVWSRNNGGCLDLSGATKYDGTPITYEDLSEKRKAVIFQYKKNSANFTAKERYSRLARGIGKPRGITYATQSDVYSDPNTVKLKRNGNVLLCPGATKISGLTSQNDTPGPLRTITNFPNVPLTNYKIQRNYLAGGGKWPQKGANIGEMRQPRRAGTWANK